MGRRVPAISPVSSPVSSQTSTTVRPSGGKRQTMRHPLTASRMRTPAIAKTANPLLLHLPLPGMDHLPSFAFATSPAEIERGPSYEFVLNHTLEMERPADLFRVSLSEVANAGQ